MKKEKKLLIRQLRAEQTDTECKLWFSLRARKLAGFKFYRQHPMGPYVVDFYCPQKRLVVELDGAWHGLNRDYDHERTRYLEARQCRVLRFWNDKVFEDKTAVLQAILGALTSD